MNTKTGLLAGAIVLTSLGLGGKSIFAATNEISHNLQQGLFEEEANHNYPVAIQAYESVISQVDSNRPLAATAIFRLGEIYRRQGKTNEAFVQYERILREFPDQEELAKLSREHLPLSTATTSPTDNTASAEFRGLANQITALKKLNQADQRILVQQQYPNPVLTSLMQQQAEAEQKLTELNKEFGSRHPNVLAAQAKLETINKQVGDQVAAVLQGLELRRDSLAASAGSAGSQSDLKDSGNLSGTEAEEIKRIRELIKNSPDLINAPQSGQQSLLQTAAGKGQLEIVKLLMANGAVVDGIKRGELTPLHYASYNGHKAVVEYLLSHGAKVDDETASGVTPLDLALSKGYESVVNTLLEAGASVNTKIRSESFRNWGDLFYSFKAGETPLHIAVESGYPVLVSILIKRGAEVNALGPRDRTPLSLAVEHQNEPAVKALIEAGADINSGAIPPLHEACAHKFEGLAEMLLAKGANPNLKSPDSTYGFPIEIAIRQWDSKILSLLLQHKADPNQRVEGPALIFAALSDPALLKPLLEAGAKADVRFGSSSPLDEAVRKNNLVGAELLLSHGAPPTPALLSAVSSSNTNMVELLLKHGADVNARDSNQNTPLHLTVRSLMIANEKALLKRHADPNLRNREGNTPLDLARENGGSAARSPGSEVIALLREYGARDDLPRMDRIEVRRPSSNYSAFEFNNGTNDWNQFTLLELMARQYGLISTKTSGDWSSRRGTSLDIFSHHLDFPDLGHLIIHRPSPDGKDWQVIPVNVAEILAADDCSRDVWLHWGDVVEVPEIDHPIAEQWPGMPDDTVSNLLRCVSRRITVKLRGSDNVINLVPEYRRDNSFSSPFGPHMYTALSGSFMLRSVLDQMKLVRFSSDLTRVKITRRDAKTGKSMEWVLDCSNPNDSPAFWLRDGDVVEIPDKQ